MRTSASHPGSGASGGRRPDSASLEANLLEGAIGLEDQGVVRGNPKARADLVDHHEVSLGKPAPQQIRADQDPTGWYPTPGPNTDKLALIRRLCRPAPHTGSRAVSS